MAEARGRFDWAQTAQVLALLYNVNRGQGAAAKSPADFNPYEAGRPRQPDVRLDARESMAALKATFGGRK